MYDDPLADPVRRRRYALLGLLFVALLAGALVTGLALAWKSAHSSGSRSGPSTVAADYVSAFNAHRDAGIRAVACPSAAAMVTSEARFAFTRTIDSLRRQGVVQVAGDRATVALLARLRTSGIGPSVSTPRLVLYDRSGTWCVAQLSSGFIAN